MSLPIRRANFDVQGFLAYVAASGGEVCKPTNAYEVVRYRAYWRGTNKATTHIVYAKENGLLTWMQGSKGHYRAFLAGEPMDELPSAPERSQTVKKSGSKSDRTRTRLVARDGTDCWFCGHHMPENDRTVEHLVPKAKGGRNTLANYALAHSKCNNEAADKPLVEKIAMRERLRGESV